MTRFILTVLALIYVTKVIESFIGSSDTETLFGLEVNIWIYRIFWVLISFWLFKASLKKKNSAEFKS